MISALYANTSKSAKYPLYFPGRRNLWLYAASWVINLILIVAFSTSECISPRSVNFKPSRWRYLEWSHHLETILVRKWPKRSNLPITLFTMIIRAKILTSSATTKFKSGQNGGQGDQIFYIKIWPLMYQGYAICQTMQSSCKFVLVSNSVSKLLSFGLK